jgi:acylphosphatase
MSYPAEAGLSAIVEGVVQGVGYRAWTVREARALRLRGRVANQPDGSVRVEAVGPPDRLRRLLDLLSKGPPAAHVRRVRATWQEIPDPGPGFIIG